MHQESLRYPKPLLPPRLKNFSLKDIREKDSTATLYLWELCPPHGVLMEQCGSLLAKATLSTLPPILRFREAPGWEAALLRLCPVHTWIPPQATSPSQSLASL